MKLLLFDIDGTLLLTGGAGRRAMQRAGKALFGARFSMDGITLAGGLDPALYEEAARRAGVEVPEHHHDAFRANYLSALVDELAVSQVRVLPGVTSLLTALNAQADVALGMVSGNYRSAAPLKLRAAGLDPSLFRWCAFGDEAADRPGLVTLAIARHCAASGHLLAPEQVVVIGDTPRDVACARACGCHCYAVATGRYTCGELLDAGAHWAAKDLSDASPFLQILQSIGAFAS